MPEAIRTAVRNNGGGHSNHTLFWQIMKTERRRRADRQRGRRNRCRVRLVRHVQGTVRRGRCRPVRQRLGLADQRRRRARHRELAQPGQPESWTARRSSSASTSGSTPTTCDTRNRRPDYISAWFNTIHWDEVNRPPRVGACMRHGLRALSVPRAPGGRHRRVAVAGGAGRGRSSSSASTPGWPPSLLLVALAVRPDPPARRAGRAAWGSARSSWQPARCWSIGRRSAGRSRACVRCCSGRRRWGAGPRSSRRRRAGRWSRRDSPRG